MDSETGRRWLKYFILFTQRALQENSYIFTNWRPWNAHQEKVTTILHSCHGNSASPYLIHGTGQFDCILINGIGSEGGRRKTSCTEEHWAQDDLVLCCQYVCERDESFSINLSNISRLLILHRIKMKLPSAADFHDVRKDKAKVDLTASYLKHIYALIISCSLW